MEVKIRYNTDYPSKSPHKWRLLVDGIQHLVDAIDINCKSRTTEDKVELNGQEVLKYHITCNPKKVEFVTKKEVKKAILS